MSFNLVQVQRVYPLNVAPCIMSDIVETLDEWSEELRFTPDHNVKHISTLLH